MSKYTTEVRYICEQAAGLKESGDFTDINSVIEKAYPKIFDVDNIPVYVPEHKSQLLQKILMHYYQREIGFETVGLWKYYLNTKLKEIMPYYNQLYKSELLEYDPLQNVNNTHTHSGLYEDTSKVDNIKKYDNVTDTENTHIIENSKKYDNITDTSDSKIDDINKNETQTTHSEISYSYDRDEDVLLKHSKKTSHSGPDSVKDTTQSARDQWTLFSDTPQGGINGIVNGGSTDGSGSIDNNTYLTNATHITDKPAQTTRETTYGSITEGYGDNSGKDHTDTTEKGSSSEDTTVKDNLTQNESSVAAGKQIDDALTTTTDSKIANEVQTDDAKTVEDNLKRDNGSDSYENREFGKIGVMTYQDMILKYRETFLNVDMMIINELGDLFMKVW